MKVSEIPILELAKVLSKYHKNLQDHMSEGSMVRLRKELYDAFRVRISDASRIDYLVERTEILKKEFKQTGIDWSLESEDHLQDNVMIIRSALEKLELSQLEFSRQQDLGVIQNIIDKYCLFVLELEVLISDLFDLDRPESKNVVLKFLSKDGPNIRFWNDIENKGFSKAFLEYENHDFVLYEVIPFGRDFYGEICSQLIRMIEDVESTTITLLYVEGEPAPKGYEDRPSEVPLHEILGNEIASVNETVNSTISKLEEVKSDIDDGYEDVNFDSLLRKVRTFAPELAKPIFQLIRKRDYIYEQLDILGSSHQTLPTQPEIKTENLSLISGRQQSVQEALKRCHRSFNGEFIEDCPPEVFVGLFVSGGFIRPVNWIRGLSTLNHFVKGISGILTHNDYWVRAKICFLNNGKQIGKGSLRKGNTHKPPPDEYLQILDDAITDIRNSRSLE